jgi:DNA-binding transcriptional LysR family regulator
MLDTHQLNVFLTAAETLNFTQAAQRLHMSQPSVSQHIRALEKHFGINLFLRSGRNLHLTDAGLTLVPMARDIVRQSIRIEETMRSLQGQISGHLIVGCSTTPGKYVLPHLLANFHHQYPGVRVTCQVSAQRQSIELLCNGKIHFALTSHLKDLCREADFRHFLCERILLVVPVEHPWAARGVIEPQELFEADFIFRESESGTYAAVQRALRAAGIEIEQLNTLLVLGNSEAIAMSVQEGLGVGFISSSVTEHIGRGRVVPVNISGIDICRDIFIGRNTRYPGTKAQIAFWEFVTGLPLPIEHIDSWSEIFSQIPLP